MTPAELHAAVLAELTAAEEAETLATAGPWHIGAAVNPLTPCNLHSAQDGRGVADGVSWQDAHLIAALRNTAAAAYAAARRIIDRHEPSHDAPDAVCVNGCYRGDGPQWPCDDYRDAARIIPHLPKEAADALRR